MQPWNAAPRDGLTEAQAKALQNNRAVRVGWGCELLDLSLNVVADISTQVADGTVKRNNKADVHGQLELTLSRELAYGRDLLRPFMRLTDPSTGISGLWYEGVYVVPLAPDSDLSQQLRTWTVNGFDLLYFLKQPIGDAYHVDGGALVLAEVLTAIRAAGLLAPVLLDSTANTKTVTAEGMTWPLLPGSSTVPGIVSGSSSFTWLDVVNGLLKSVGYQNIWADWNGALRSSPDVAANQRATEYDLTIEDRVVKPERTATNTVMGVPNQWPFYMNGLTTQPVAGTSLYVRDNPSTGPASQDALGYPVRATPQGLDAVDFAALQTQGDAIADAAIRVTDTLTSNLGPFTAAWHLDVVNYHDPAWGDDRVLLGSEWTLPLRWADPSTSMNYVWETV